MNNLIHFLRILFYFSASIGGLVIAWHILCNFKKARKSEDYLKLIYNALALVCIIISAVSWVLNFGWLRHIASLVLFPVLHSLLFWFTDNYAATYLKSSKILWLSMFISYVTFVMFYLFLPDANGEQAMYALFKNITTPKALDMCFYVSLISFMINSMALIFQIVFGMYVKKKTSN